MRTNILSIIILATISLFAQDNIWDNLDKGNYQVGFKVCSLYDSTRTIDNQKKYRPIQVSTWYPAQVSQNPEPMKYKDYFLLSISEIDFDVPDELVDSSIAEYKNLLLQNGVNDNAFDEWFNTQMIANKNAIPIERKFPLVIVAQGNYHSAHHQSFLCEFLASNGYVVITTPSQTRISGQMTDNAQAVESAEEQAKDMEFAIRSVSKFNNVDLNNIALIGHSFGGRSTVLLQMKNENVKCIVSLDSGLGLNTAIDDIKKTPGFNSEKMNVPLLHIYEDDEEFIKPDFTLINSFNQSEIFLIKINDMHHFYFSSLGFVSGTIDGFSPASENLAAKYKLVCDITRDFLNAAFEHSDKAMESLKNEFSAIADSTDFVTFQFK
ncbi:MAG TPA: dienelactone hydrolase family protein [Ignavibacteriaceae bacterium]